MVNLAGSCLWSFVVVLVGEWEGLDSGGAGRERVGGMLASSVLGRDGGKGLVFVGWECRGGREFSPSSCGSRIDDEKSRAGAKMLRCIVGRSCCKTLSVVPACPLYMMIVLLQRLLGDRIGNNW